MKKLREGQQVVFVPNGASCVVESVQHDGLVGILRKGREGFTAFAEECREVGEAPALDELLEVEQPSLHWKLRA